MDKVRELQKKFEFKIDQNDMDFREFDSQTANVGLEDINSYISCPLCAGYLINATTITECTHTFCKSCIVKHLQTRNKCPQCERKVHETSPLMSLRSDTNMQEVVYTLVPGLFKKELQNEVEFYKSRGMSFARSKSHLLTINTTPHHREIIKRIVGGEEMQEGKDQTPETRYDSEFKHLNSVSSTYSHDEKIRVKFQSDAGVSGPMKFALCPSRSTLKQVKKMLKIALKLEDSERVCLYSEEFGELDEMHTIKQAALMCYSHVNEQNHPVVLNYKVLCC